MENKLTIVVCQTPKGKWKIGLVDSNNLLLYCSGCNKELFKTRNKALKHGIKIKERYLHGDKYTS